MVITLHDAWLLGGHCVHSFDCEKWKTGCGNCPHLNIYPVVKRDATAYNWRLKKNIYAKSRVYISTPSQWLMDKVEKSILMPAIIKKKVIPNGVDLNIFCPKDKKSRRKKLELPTKAHILLFISDGIESHWRDYNMIEEVVMRLSQKKLDSPLLMICLGWEAQAKKFGNTEIRFLPYQKSLELLSCYYQASDILLLSSKADTFPTVTLEAAACGVPVVATAVGGIPEQIENGKTGFLIPSGDSKQMADKVEKLLNNNDIWNSFSLRAAEVSRERFNLEDQIEKHLCWYSEILEEWPKP